MYGNYREWILEFVTTQAEVQKSFEKRREEARKKYWDACKYPRKKKKRIRKEAKEEYNFANMCAQTMF